MRIAVGQTRVTSDARANGRAIRDQMRQAAQAGARLIHFTEGAISGYPSGEGKKALAGWDVDWRSLREELEATVRLAGELRIWVVVGANHPLTPPHRPHNSLYVISDTGELHGRYDKRPLSFTEVTDWYSPGSEPFVFEVNGFRFGCALCIEIQFPELFVDYASRGVDAVLLSTFSEDPMFAIQAQGHAACGAFWLSLSVPSQYSHAAPSGVIGPDFCAPMARPHPLRRIARCGEGGRLAQFRHGIVLRTHRLLVGQSHAQGLTIRSAPLPDPDTRPTSGHSQASIRVRFLADRQRVKTPFH